MPLPKKKFELKETKRTKEDRCVGWGSRKVQSLEEPFAFAEFAKDVWIESGEATFRAPYFGLIPSLAFQGCVRRKKRFPAGGEIGVLLLLTGPG